MRENTTRNILFEKLVYRNCVKKEYNVLSKGMIDDFSSIHTYTKRSALSDDHTASIKIHE